ncbi:FKBP-type peptidyl-prolyl cis-trans isomerase [Mucilaginibacter glaciei]|uniref:peptidylprolyl isomerase n=1 Tax=Mucilaginibacter glaciei TaxID=2772109 RepID=A0A926NQM1_9SPHI|nr:FKBP-type peptidyl-prolyl cis-trans isomerase [Mucilaginibacter glaciei]MBD1394186.1 FKBP-type peptidyl-prolyl cis-trans isomerase [Mucilaginibacter glaciei]
MKNIFYTILLVSVAGLSANAQTGMQRNAKGVQYQLISKNAGEKIKQNDVITFQAVQRTDKDSILFSTYLQGQPVKAQVRPSTNIGDLMDIFPLMGAGDSAVVKVPIDSIFKGHEEARPPFLLKGGNLVFNIKIVQVQSLNEAMAERNAAFEKMKMTEKAGADTYIKSHNLAVTTTPSGLRYIITKVGTKPKPLTGDTLTINYVGRTLDGKLFDTSIESVAKAGGTYMEGRPYEPIQFPHNMQKVIAGWDEALSLLNEGSKATLIIPSNLAYGERGSGEKIPPFSTLVFDVEMVKVNRVKHTAVAAKTGAKKPAKTPLKKRAPLKKKN